MKRKRILSDYERRTDADGKDSYIYTGPLFAPDLSPARLLRFRVAAWVYPIIGLLLWLVMCLPDTEGMRQMYVALPCVSLSLPLCLLLGDAYKVTTQRAPMQRAEYERSYAQMRRCTLAIVVLSSMVFAAEGVFLLATATSVGGEFALWGISVVQFSFFFTFLALQKHIQFTTHR